MADPGGGADAAEAVARIRRRTAERRAAGEDPDALEARMDAHLARVASLRAPGPDPLDPVRATLADLDGTTVERHDLPPTSGIPGGEVVHRAVARLVGRHLDDLVGQLHTREELQDRLGHQLLAVLEDRAGHAELLEHLDAALDGLVRLEAALVGADDPALRWYDAGRWADRFEGPYEAAVAASAPVAAALVGRGPVAVLHAGRGEVVAALLAAGARPAEVRASDPDPDLAEAASAHGAEVRTAAAAAALAACADGELAGAALVRGLSRLGPTGLLGVVAAASRAVRSRGALVLAGEVPGSAAATRAAACDPAHVGAVDPELAAWLCEEAGWTVAAADDAPPGAWRLTATR